MKNFLPRNHLLILTALLALSFLFWNETILAITETRYHRSDTQTVNGETGYQLKISNSNSSIELTQYGPEWLMDNCPEQVPDNGYFRTDVYVKHIDGTETLLGSNAAQTQRGGEYGGLCGYQSATWTPPPTKLIPTDAIKIVEKVIAKNEYFSTSRTFITEPLDAYWLNSTPWTFTRSTCSSKYCSYRDASSFYVTSIFSLSHGSSNKATRIDGFSYEKTMDCGLRTFDGTQTISVACEPPGINGVPIISPLRIRKNNTTYGVILVNSTHPDASKLKIMTGSGIKSLRKL